MAKFIYDLRYTLHVGQIDAGHVLPEYIDAVYAALSGSGLAAIHEGEPGHACPISLARAPPDNQVGSVFNCGKLRKGGFEIFKKLANRMIAGKRGRRAGGEILIQNLLKILR